MDLCAHASVILLASVLSNFSEADEQVTENLGAFAVVMSCMPALALGSAFLLVMHPEVYGRFFPGGARSRLDNQSKTIKNVCDAIAALPDADLRELILHLGEWERTTLTSACSAVSVELGYEKGKRLTDQKLHSTGSKSKELRNQISLQMDTTWWTSPSTSRSDARVRAATRRDAVIASSTESCTVVSPDADAWRTVSITLWLTSDDAAMGRSGNHYQF